MYAQQVSLVSVVVIKCLLRCTGGVTITFAGCRGISVQVYIDRRTYSREPLTTTSAGVRESLTLSSSPHLPGHHLKRLKHQHHNSQWVTICGDLRDYVFCIVALNTSKQQHLLTEKLKFVALRANNGQALTLKRFCDANVKCAKPR